LIKQGGLVGAENDRPSLEVRFRSDGHPPFTEREREIHLNGTGGVKIYDGAWVYHDPGLLFLRKLTSNAQRPTPNTSMQKRFLVER
jgi:hypothetical protein